MIVVKDCGHVMAWIGCAENDEEKPDLVLMDINIHGEMDGVEAARHLSARNIPIIFTTGYYDAKMKKKAAGIKPVAYLVKPLDHEQLRAIISGVFK